MNASLTATQERILTFVRANPHTSYRDIVAGCTLSSTSVAKYNVQVLAARGLVSMGIPGLARQITAVDGTSDALLPEAVRRLIGSVEVDGSHARVHIDDIRALERLVWP